MTLPAAWRAAVGDPRIARELEAIYEEAAAAVAERRPVCTASGRCCHFDAYGHRLYVTGLEAAYTLSRVPRVIDRGSARSAPPSISLPILTAEALTTARARGSCPFLKDNLCTVHTIKPLACRTYYCDPTAQEWQQDLTERLIQKLRILHDRHGIEYRYAEWREMLGLFA